MGSYTNATANEFNGFPKPDALSVYIDLPPISSFLDRIPSDIKVVEPVSSAYLLK
jgi:hypothetical protein